MGLPPHSSRGLSPKEKVPFNRYSSLILLEEGSSLCQHFPYFQSQGTPRAKRYKSYLALANESILRVRVLDPMKNAQSNTLKAICPERHVQYNMHKAIRPKQYAQSNTPKAIRPKHVLKKNHVKYFIPDTRVLGGWAIASRTKNTPV